MYRIVTANGLRACLDGLRNTQRIMDILSEYARYEHFANLYIGYEYEWHIALRVMCENGKITYHLPAGDRFVKVRKKDALKRLSDIKEVLECISA